MKTSLCFLAFGLSLFFAIHSTASTLYVDLNSRNPAPPFSDWGTAATSIQDAIDAATDGDQIWVTNGVYNAGGRVMAGNLTNRAALNKAVTVQSVNGPLVTVIQGAGATNGNAAVRCAWLTNNASLVGFTLTGGATRNSGDAFSLESGGGVWCASSNATVTGCLIISNTAYADGGGAFQGTLNSCLVRSNGSMPNFFGGAVYSASLNNCTVVSNSVVGTTQCRSTNSIVYYNGGNNYSGGTFYCCCVKPSAGGLGNFTNAPELFVDGIHPSGTSPCIGAGTISAMIGVDFFGHTWASPPSVGCAEAVPLVTTPQIQLTSEPVGFTIGGASFVAGDMAGFNWLKNGTLLQDDGHFSSTTSSNLVATGVTFADAGNYQLVVSSSAGTVTSSVVPLVIHCVNWAGTNPTPPYTDWATAATNIQDAIDAASSNEFVLVTNGIYSGGGKVMVSDLTNRVALNKALAVMSVNGCANTVIEGQWDPVSTNGPGAIRCAWIGDGAVLNGFTLCNGATRGSGIITTNLHYGGGAWLSANGLISDCVLTNNQALYAGGGVAFGTANNCLLTYNTSQYGGGAYSARLNNCTIRENHTPSSSGGAGVSSCKSYNSIIANNYYGLFGNPDYQLANYYIGSIDTFTNCCVSPLPFRGSDNITASPLFLADNFHLAPASPCRGAGSSLYASGYDIDGEPFLNPPSIGCDEFIETNMTGPLSVTFNNPSTEVVANHSLHIFATIDGRPSSLEWLFGDGPAVTNLSYIGYHIWTNAGTYPVTLTLYNMDHPEGVSSSILVNVDPFLSPSLTSLNIVSNSCQFSFFAQLFVPYNIQYTSNLSPPITWQTIPQPIDIFTNGTVTFSDPIGTNGMRFYRVKGQ